MKFHYITIFFATPILISCTAPAYVQPTSGVTAELTIERTTKSGRLFPMIYYPASRCTGVQQIERIDYDSDEARTVRIAAERKTYLRLDSYDRNTQVSCSVPIEFEPRAGQRYKAEWSMIGNRCYARLGTIHSHDGTEVFIPDRTARSSSGLC